MNRREKTRAIKKVLRKAGYPVVSVTHGSGVAAKWINIKLFMEGNRLNEISQKVERLAAKTAGRETWQDNCITMSCCFRSRQEMKMRGCEKCEELKPLTEFSKDRTKKDGFSVICKKCKSSYKKEYKARNPERYLAMARACNKRHRIRYPERAKAKARESAKRCFERNPEKVKARQEREARKIDRTLHPEKYKALERKKARAYLDKNRDKLNAKRRARYANDPEFKAKEKERLKKRKHQRRAAYIKRRERDPEKYRAKGKAIYARAWAKDPEKYRARSRKSQQKRKAEKTRIMLLKAFDIVQSELTDVNGHKERLEKARAKIKARQEREEKKEDKILHPEKYKAQAKERALAYYYKNREKLLAKAKAKRAREPEKNLAYGRKYFHKRHGGMTKFMHVIAEILLTINLLKGNNDDKRTK